MGVMQIDSRNKQADSYLEVIYAHSVANKMCFMVLTLKKIKNYRRILSFKWNSYKCRRRSCFFLTWKRSSTCIWRLWRINFAFKKENAEGHCFVFILEQVWNQHILLSDIQMGKNVLWDFRNNFRIWGWTWPVRNRTIWKLYCS